MHYRRQKTVSVSIPKDTLDFLLKFKCFARIRYLIELGQKLEGILKVK